MYRTAREIEDATENIARIQRTIQLSLQLLDQEGRGWTLQKLADSYEIDIIATNGEEDTTVYILVEPYLENDPYDLQRVVDRVKSAIRAIGNVYHTDPPMCQGQPVIVLVIDGAAEGAVESLCQSLASIPTYPLVVIVDGKVLAVYGNGIDLEEAQKLCESMGLCKPHGSGGGGAEPPPSNQEESDISTTIVTAPPLSLMDGQVRMQSVP
ncbi:MAG: hypothetical protein QHG94_06690 [Candidatus Methanosuratincola sp.]|nr:hypothetical protein [Candidatus Methanosuratincola sp.]